MTAARSAGQRFSAEDIRAATSDIAAAFRDAPQYVHEGLSKRLGMPVVVKVETLNPIRAFKGRGTWLAVNGLAGEGRLRADHGAIVASSGNFGQGVAYACRALGLPATVYVSEPTPATKVARMRGLGARVVVVGRDFDEAREACEAEAAAGGGLLIIDGQEPRVAVGNGTMAVEVTDGVAAGALPPIGAAYVPLGNGALLAGIGTWLRAASPATRVVGVVAAGAPCMAISWREGRPIETTEAATYAEGIACRVPVPEALDDLRGVVDDVLEVSEDDLHRCQDELRGELGITVEGAAASSWAGALASPPAGGAALLIITGSNVPPTTT
ncbi:MAG TPA: pyridoxal-phosphate dependent enzyme [Candidatus Limnocylindrales bacterium]|jgi:threonine dehydratase